MLKHPIRTGAAVLVLVILVSALFIVPLMRKREMRDLESIVVESSTLLDKAMRNNAIVTGQPLEDVTRLEDDAKNLARVHDRAVLMPVYVARSARQSTLDYTDYAAHLGLELAQSAKAESQATEAAANYDRAVSALKASVLANRVSAQQTMNDATAAARASSDSAYGEFVQLDQLSRTFGAAQSQVLRVFETVGPDVEASVGALRPALESALDQARRRRNRFNRALGES